MSRTPHPPSPSGLPALQAGLADAFAAEVTQRVPRLVDSAARMTADPTHPVSEFVSDAHALASSAAILGEDLASHAARECELLLLPYVDRPVPVEVVERARGAVDAVRLALSHWIAAGTSPRLAPRSAAVHS